MFKIEDSVKNIIQSIPDHVILVGAAKTRSLDEVKIAVNAGLNILGYNYLQEAMAIKKSIGNHVEWHMIGHLQKNKVKKAVEIFDMIETIDSFKLAKLVDKYCNILDKIMPVLLEINIAREDQKAGILPENVIEVAKKISVLPNIQIKGLMTMGPFTQNAEDLRPYFRDTKILFDTIAHENIPNIEMKFLSMGMSNSYEVAIDEGANMIRLGTILFGPRKCSI